MKTRWELARGRAANLQVKNLEVAGGICHLLLGLDSYLG